ncbi:MAG: hypothetical protein ACLQJ0_16050 [Steroidobacteraceae bacterium]
MTPDAQGVLFVTLNVSLKHDQMTESRAFLVPIIVGEIVARDETGAAKQKK